MERRSTAGGRQAAVGAEVGSCAIGSPVLRWHFIDGSEELRHRDQRDLCIGVFDRGKLTQPRRVDPDRHRGVGRQRMVRVFRVCIPVVERGVCRCQPKLPIDTVVMVVVVERRTQEVARHHQHQQPPREPPCAAHTTHGAARKG